MAWEAVLLGFGVLGFRLQALGFRVVKFHEA